MIINFLPVCEGGGLQNSLSFISQLERDDIVFIVRKDSLIEKALMDKNQTIISVNSGRLNRLWFELTCRKHLVASEVCFTFFGPPLLGSINYSHNICGFAYSNLLYPEINFWWFFPLYKKCLKQLIDLYRKTLISFADEIIYETDVLLERGLTDKKLHSIVSHVVKMSPSTLVSPHLVEQSSSLFKNISAIKGKKLLFLCGPQPNKRVREFLPVLKELNRHSEIQFNIVTTIDNSAGYFADVMIKASELGVDDCVYSVGKIPPSMVSTLIASVDAVVNVALLESFSNNFSEAWCMSKPLVVTNADWGRDSCGSAAIYIDLDNPIIASSIIINGLATFSPEESIKQQRRYPTSKQKYFNYMQILEQKEQ